MCVHTHTQNVQTENTTHTCVVDDMLGLLQPYSTVNKYQTHTFLHT